MKHKLFPMAVVVTVVTAGLFSTASISAATLTGQVLGGGAPIANSAVTLWTASATVPKQVAQATTGADGRFTINAPDTAAPGTSLYLVAKGGQVGAGSENPAIALLWRRDQGPAAAIEDRRGQRA
ncbi:MAG: hypothetical protein H6R12_2652 [Proteobacteria bacterium]|nr:hypothetical protein [Pseudomonadota bacterium]